MALAKDLQIYKDTFELVDKLTAMKVGFRECIVTI